MRTKNTSKKPSKQNVDLKDSHKDSAPLSEDDEIKMLFKNNEAAFSRYKQLRTFSRLNHSECIVFLKRFFEHVETNQD